MSRSIRYRMPAGVEIVGETGNTVTLNIAIPADDTGYFGRKCPKCGRIFRMHVEDYEALPDHLRLTCPYCCIQEDHSEFMTKQQTDRVLAAAGEYAQQLVAGMLDDAFGDMARSVNARGGAIRMRYSGGSRTHFPRPLPAIVEEAPIRERTCTTCGNRYAIFGEHIACPVCGPLPPKVVAQDALEAQDAVLDIFDHIPAEVLQQLREAGAVERTAASSLGSVVSILETFLKQAFLHRVTGGDNLIAGKGNVFQRLDTAAQLYHDHCGIDLPAILGTADWHRLCLLYGIRHLVTHTNGVVDAKHMIRFPGHGVAVGQRVTLSFADAREALHFARKLVDGVL